jgi:hypothetical protein
MPKLEILLVFTNVRGKNIDTIIGDYFDLQYSLKPKSAIPYFFYLIFPNARVGNIRG